MPREWEPDLILSDEGWAELDRLKRVIKDGLPQFVEVGRALATIRDKKLYRASHKTFEAFCKEEFGFGKSHAYRLIEASDLATEQNVPNWGQNDNLSKSPENAVEAILERQFQVGTEYKAREIARVRKQYGEEAKARAVEILGSGPVTKEKLREVKEAITEAPPEHPWEPDAAKFAEAVRLADQLHAAIRDLFTCKYGGGRKFAQGGFLVNSNGKPHCVPVGTIRSHLRMSRPATCPRCDGAGCQDCGDRGWVCGRDLHRLKGENDGA